MSKIIFLILLPIMLIACHNSITEVKEYYDNGQLKRIKYHNKEGESIGEWKGYYEDGHLKYTRRFKNGRLIEVKRFHNNGELKDIVNFENEKMIGERNEYHDNGKLWLKRNYLNGILVGSYEQYHKNGHLFVKGTYNDVGERNGEHKFYYEENGKLWKSGNYNNGKQHGKWKVYHKNGNVYQVQLWKNDKYQEIISCFDDKGNLLDKGTLENGNGIVKEYLNEKLVQETEYLKGKKQE